MKFLYSEITKNLEKKPSLKDIKRELTDKAFEVEEVIPISNDTSLEVKILPDRPDCKNSEGLEREIASILNLKLVYEISKNPRTKIKFTAKEMCSILGKDLSEKRIIKFLERLYINIIKIGETLTAEIPEFRKDLNIVEDLADEIGRLYGINKIPAAPLPEIQWQSKPDPTFTLTNTLRHLLLENGFTEVYGYTLAPKGEMETEKPLAADKAFLRTNLTDGLKEKLNLNLQNNIFDQVPVKIFEIGSVFAGNSERIYLAVARGFKSPKFKKGNLKVEFREMSDLTAAILSQKEGLLYSDSTMEIFEIDIDLENNAGLRKRINEIGLKPDKELFGNLKSYIKDVEFRPFSLQPMIIRDIALWVDSSVSSEKVSDLIKKNAEKLLVEGPYLFDEFKKDEKISYAFRLVFQSYEKTLTDAEAESFMEKIKQAVSKKSWEVR